MANKKKIEEKLNLIFNKYKTSFDNKVLSKEKTTTDLIMKIFNKTQNDVDINKQYWNREFGKYFEYTVSSIFSITRDDFKPGLRIKSDEVCDCIIGNLAIVAAKFLVLSSLSSYLSNAITDFSVAF